MGCICQANLKAILNQLRNLPMSLLASLLPTPLPTNQMASLSAALGAQVTASAQLSAMAQLAASANLSANLSASAVARLEALAAIRQHLGIHPFSPSASARLSLAIHSANLHLPTFGQLLSQLLAPIAELLREISAAIAALLSVRSQLGVNLLASAQVNLQALVSARLAALASLKANATVMAKAQLAAIAKLDLHARLVAAAQVLGINLALPGAFAQLNAALTAAARMSLPNLNVGMGLMGALAAMLGQLAAIGQGLGINLLTPQAAGLLGSARVSLQAAVKAMAGIQLNARAAAALNARATAQLTAKANVSAAAKAAASINFAGFLPVMPPAMPKLNMLANLTAQLSFLTPVMSTTPCGSCAFGRV